MNTWCIFGIRWNINHNKEWLFHKFYITQLNFGYQLLWQVSLVIDSFLWIEDLIRIKTASEIENVTMSVSNLFPFDFKIVRLLVQVLLQNEAETSRRPGFFQRQKQNDCLWLQSKLKRHFFPFGLFLHVLTWVNFKWLCSKMNSGNPFALSLLQSLQHIAWIMYTYNILK